MTDKLPCSCTSQCHGQSGLSERFVCVRDNPGIHELLMTLPAGKTCADCIRFSRCKWLGCTWPERTQCDFYPNLFKEPAVRAQTR